MASYNKENIYAGLVEFKMPKAMADAYLKNRNKADQKIEPNTYLVRIINEEFGLKGRCVNVHVY